MKKFKFLLLAVSSLAFGQIADEAHNISPLLIGEEIPKQNLITLEGEISSEELFSNKTVLIVYRGGWCPYCNTQLMEMQDIESQIIDLGYKVVAVSPDGVDFLKQTVTEDELNYTLLSDSSGKFMESLGLLFKAPEKYQKMLAKYSEDGNSGFLPVPAVYVVDKKGVIDFMYVSPNYKKRLSGSLLLAALKTIE